MLQRMFLPVGQGAFYSEKLSYKNENKYVIYDCGSNTSTKTLQTQIKNNLPLDESIFIIFISHFDRDHINGLEYILNNYKVENIVIPYIYEKDRYTLALKYLFMGRRSPKKITSSFIYKLIIDPASVIDQKTNLYYVMPYDKEKYDNNNFANIIESTQNLIHSGESVLAKIRNKNTKEATIFEELHWKFVPFNFKENERADLFYKKLKSLSPHGINEPKKILSLLTNNDTESEIKNELIAALKKAYKSVEGDINTKSMTLFSGTKLNCKCQRLLYKAYFCKTCLRFTDEIFCTYFDCTQNGCLYTGDYDAKDTEKWNDMKKAYNDYWQFIGCVQIPHHGSCNNYNPEFTLMDSYFVVSAGISAVTKQKHPHKTVIEDFKLKNIPLHIVTENEESIIITEVILPYL